MVYWILAYVPQSPPDDLLTPYLCTLKSSWWPFDSLLMYLLVLPMILWLLAYVPLGPPDDQLTPCEWWACGWWRRSSVSSWPPSAPSTPQGSTAPGSSLLYNKVWIITIRGKKPEPWDKLRLLSVAIVQNIMGTIILRTRTIRNISFEKRGNGVSDHIFLVVPSPNLFVFSCVKQWLFGIIWFCYLLFFPSM